MIKKYQDFIKEKYTLDQNDAPELAASKTSFNKMENDIKEFLTKKTVVDNIYLTYTDEKDLVSKLFAQKFIPLNTGDKKKISFINPLIGLYAQASDKKRDLKRIEDELSSQNDTMSQRQTTISQNPDTSDSLKNDVTYIQGKISDINKQMSTLKNEITSLEKSTELKLKQMKVEMAANKKRLDYFMQNK